MSVADELELLRSNVSDTYDAIEAKGGTIPSDKNTANLSSAVESIPSGGGDGIITEADAQALGYDEQTRNDMNAALAEAVGPAIDEGYNDPSRWTLSSISSEWWLFDGSTPTVAAYRNVKYLPFVDTSSKTSTDFSYAGFQYFSNLRSIPKYDFSALTSAVSMFNGCSSLTSVDISTMSNVTYDDSMFKDCSSLTSVDASSMVSLVQSSNMFRGCSALTSVDVSGMNAVTIAGSMFNGCSSLTSVDVSGMTALTNANYMFNGCVSLSEINISGTDLTQLTSYSGMFNNVPTTCHIIVKDQASKDWMATNFSSYTNVTIKGE